MAICLPSPYLSLYQLFSSKFLSLKGLLWKWSILILVLILLGKRQVTWSKVPLYQPSQLCVKQRQQTLAIPFHTLLVERLGLWIRAVQEGMGAQGEFDDPRGLLWEVSAPTEEEILRNAEYRSSKYGTIS